MATIRPFHGIRPRPDVAQQVASPPYDVLSSDEARDLVRSNPSSFLRVNKPEVDFPPGTDAHSEQIYQAGKRNLERLIADGTMARDERASYYLYRLTMDGVSQTGLMALTSVDEYDQGKIKKHEHTRPDKVRDRADHIELLGAQVGPVFSIFRQRPEISAAFGKLTQAAPTVDFTADDGVRHEMWVIDAPESIEALEAAFAPLPEIYIADGHHRSESASEVRRRLRARNPAHQGDEIYNFFLNVIFPDDELRILSYNRVVADLKGHTPEGMLALAQKAFDVAPSEAAVNPETPLQIGVYCAGQWHRLEPRAGTYDAKDPAESLASAILTSNLLGPVLGIENIRTDNRIHFVGGIRGIDELIRLVDSGRFAVAFSLHPVTVEQLLSVADADQVMPPKSTWFEPKLRSGMVVNSL